MTTVHLKEAEIKKIVALVDAERKRVGYSLILSNILAVLNHAGDEHA